MKLVTAPDSAQDYNSSNDSSSKASNHYREKKYKKIGLKQQSAAAAASSIPATTTTTSNSKKWFKLGRTLTCGMFLFFVLLYVSLQLSAISIHWSSSGSFLFLTQAVRPDLNILFEKAPLFSASSSSSPSDGASNRSSSGGTSSSFSSPSIRQQQRFMTEEEIVHAALETVIKLFNESTVDRATTTTTNEFPPKRIAIIIGGTLQRFHFTNLIQHLILPLRQQNHSIGVYALLTTATTKAYRQDAGYMNRIHWDPIFTNGANLLDNVNNPSKSQMQTPTHELVAHIIRRALRLVGATVPSLILRDTIDIDSEPLLKEQRRIAKLKYPDDEDIDLRFPLLDIRNAAARKRTISGNRNILKLMRGIQKLWNILKKNEAKLTVQYDYVFILRDDTMFLQDFDFNALLKIDEQEKKKGTKPIDAFVLSCDARTPPMHPREMNDHGIIIRRAKADIMGDYYSEMFRDHLLDNCSSLLGQDIVKGGQRGCNSEMILKYVLENLHHLRIQTIGQALFPFQRSVNLATKDGRILPCFHKLCQSHDHPLLDTRGVQSCKAFYTATLQQESID